MRNAGVALRVRDTGGGHVQTIKAGGRVLFDRPEWEQRAGGLIPDLQAAQATGLAPLLDARVRERLRAQFRTCIDRTIYRVDRNGSGH